MTTSFTYQIRHGASANAPVIIGLHGFGSSDAEFAHWDTVLDPRFTLVVPRGIYTLKTGSYAWYHVKFPAEGPQIQFDETQNSLQYLSEFVQYITQTYDVNAEQVYLMGFSQGAIIGLNLLLTHPEFVTGVGLLSGRVLPEIKPYRGVFKKRATGGN